MLYLLITNYLAFGLLILGLALIIAEAFITSFGILGILGGIAFIIGTVMLIEGPSIGYHVPVYLIILLSLVMLAAVLLIVTLTWRSQHRPVITGREALIGYRGKITQTDHKNWLYIKGERWQCESRYTLQDGEEVVIEDLDGLVCLVRPAAKSEEEEKEI